jgi:hypothetical protein
MIKLRDLLEAESIYNEPSKIKKRLGGRYGGEPEKAIADPGNKEPALSAKKKISEAIPDLRTLPRDSMRRRYNKARKYIVKMRLGGSAKEFAREYMMWKTSGERGPEPQSSSPRVRMVRRELDHIFKESVNEAQSKSTHKKGEVWKDDRGGPRPWAGRSTVTGEVLHFIDRKGAEQWAKPHGSFLAKKKRHESINEVSKKRVKIRRGRAAGQKGTVLARWSVASTGAPSYYNYYEGEVYRIKMDNGDELDILDKNTIPIKESIREAKEFKWIATIDGTDAPSLFISDVKDLITKKYKGTFKLKREHGFHMMDFEITIPDKGDILSARDADRVEKYLNQQGANVKRLSEAVASAKDNVTPEESEEMEKDLKKDVNFTTNSPKMFETQDADDAQFSPTNFPTPSIEDINETERGVAALGKLLRREAHEFSHDMSWAKTRNPGSPKTPVGEVQSKLMKVLHGLGFGDHQLADLVRSPEFRNIHFKRIQTAASALKKKKLVNYDGTSKVSLVEALNSPIDTYKGWKIFALSNYMTPYYYPEKHWVKGRQVGGSMDHSPRIRKVHQMIDLWLKRMGKKSLDEAETWSKTVSDPSKIQTKKQTPKAISEND